MAEIENLPHGWLKTKISELCQLNPKHSKEIDDETEISFVPMADVSDKDGEIIGCEIRKLGKVRKGYTHFVDNDVIWAKITPCMENGKAALAKGLNNGLACGSTEFYVLRSKGTILPIFLYFYIRQESFRKDAKMAMGGAVGHQRVPKDFLLNRIFSLPPLPEQKRITDKIETLNAKSKKAKQALENTKPLLDKLRQSILASAFRGDLTADWRKKNPDVESASVLLKRIRSERRKKWEENELAKMKAKGKEPKNDKWKSKYKEPELVDTNGLPDIPEGWCWVTLEMILKESRIGLIRAAREQSENEGTPYIRMGHYDSSGSWNFKSLTYVEVNETEFEEYELKTGDVLFNTRNSYELVGKTSIWPENKPGYVYNNNLLRLRLCNNTLPSFIAYQMQSPFFVNLLLESKSATTNICAIYTRELMKKPLAIPSIDEQIQIQSKIDLMFEKNDYIRKIINESTMKIRKTDQATLKKAFLGELVPQNPNDEPASVLLEKIKNL